MAMVIKCSLFIAALCCTLVAVAQSKKLMVYHTTGNVVVMQKQKGVSEDARRGYVINNACILKLVTPASRVMIIDSTGVYATLDKPAAYSFDSLAGIITKLSRQGLTSKFFRYVWVNFTHGHHEEKLPNNVTGGVFRSKIPMEYPGNNRVVADGIITFRWTKDKPNFPYRFILRDAVTKTVLTSLVLKKELELKVDARKKGMQAGALYEWSVDEDETTQPHNTFFRLLLANTADNTAINSDYKVLATATFTKEESNSIMEDILLKWQEFYKTK
jgi:hypothetical protein